jgi:hypothetical protein
VKSQNIQEIDLMKYYNNHDKYGKFVSGGDLSRTFETENDVLGLNMIN